MSSSDYTSIKKYRQLQCNCDVDEDGNPIDSCSSNLPPNSCNYILGTGPMGPTGPQGSEGPMGASNGGVFVISGEAAAGFSTGSGSSASGYIFSYGDSGDSSGNGINIGFDCSLHYIGIQIESAPTMNGFLEIYKIYEITNNR